MAQFDTNQVARELDKNMSVLGSAISALSAAYGDLPLMMIDNGNYVESEVKALLTAYDALTVNVIKPPLSLDDSLAIIRAAV